MTTMTRPQTQTKDELRAAIVGMGGEDRLRSSMTKPELQHLAEALLLEHDPDAPPPATLGDLREQKDGAVEESLAGYDAAVEKPVPGTDVELRDAVSTLPTFSKWQQMEAMASRLSRSNLVPAALRGKDADVLLVMLAAHDLGITATQGLQKLHVIEGKVGMAAELMVALVLAAGHEIRPAEVTEEAATAVGRRTGSDHEGSFTFTMEDARRASLANKGPWKSYPKAMLWARAVSGLCRQMFPDCLSGVSYTPEELGSIDAEGYETPVTQQGEPERLPAAQDVRDGIAGRLGELTDEQRACVAAQWKELRLYKLPDLHADEVGTVMRLITECVAANPADAEVVPTPSAEAGPVADAQAFLDSLPNDECAQCRCIEPLNDAGLCSDCAAAQEAPQT